MRSSVLGTALGLVTALLLGGAPDARAQATPAPATATAAPSLTIQVFSMGQADAMLIVGRSKTVLVDCGTPTKGWRGRHTRVAEGIRRLTGGSKVDALVVTHFHSDHVGEAPEPGRPGAGIWGLVDAGIRFGTIYDHGDRYPFFGDDTFPHREWLKALPGWKRSGVFDRRKTPSIGERIALGGGAELRFVAQNGNGELQRDAARFRNGVAPNENDYSLAFVLSSGKFELFSGGDMSGADTRAQPGRDTIYTDIESLVSGPVGNIEVLRVNHHGSRHSSNGGFVSTLRPEVSLISCGRDNPYGHPATEVVRRLAAEGKVLATSGLARDWKGRSDAPEVCGDIVVRVAGDGATYTVQGRNGQYHAARAYADWEEALGLDKHGGPRIPFLVAGR